MKKEKKIKWKKKKKNCTQKKGSWDQIVNHTFLNNTHRVAQNTTPIEVLTTGSCHNSLLPHRLYPLQTGGKHCT